MPSTLRPPRSAPSLTTSFSLPSLADYPPSPADPNFPPKQWHGPFASLSRRGSRWEVDDGAGAADASSDSDDAMLRRTQSERNLKKRRQLESQVLSLKTIISEQANALSALNTANFDLGETIERLKGAARDAEDERRAADTEREWLLREVEQLRKLTGINETPPTLSYAGRRPGSAGRTPLESKRAQKAVDENVPPVPDAIGGTEAQRKMSRRRVAERRNAPHPSSIRTETLAPAISPSPFTADARLQSSTALSPFPPADLSASPFPVPLSATAGMGARAVRPKPPARRTLSARRKRSLELLSLSAGLLDDGPTVFSAVGHGRGGEEGEWQEIVRTQGYLSLSDLSDDEPIERRPNLRPSALPVSKSGWRQVRATEVRAVDGEGEGFDATEGELMEALKRLVPDSNVRRFRHLVKKLDNAVLSPTEFLVAARSTVVDAVLPSANGPAEKARRAREDWALALEQVVWWQVEGADKGVSGEQHK